MRILYPVLDRVVFAGFRDDIPDVMKTIDSLVLPSFWEGFGIVLIEAMASGKPVVSTVTSNIPEVVNHQKEGILVRPGSSSELHGALHLLAKNTKLREKMGIAGRDRVMRNFTLARMVDQTERLFLQHVFFRQTHSRKN
jgi:glycosyltransferase involved in cell wall biosynthesis